jgi:hypothetical protein
MQGVFWPSVLNPAIDDDDQRVVRDDELRRARERDVARLRAGGGGADGHGGVPAIEVTRPVAPALRLRIKKQTVYVVRGGDFELRQGEWGHYRVTYKIMTGGKARPFREEGRVEHPDSPIEEGYPGADKDDTQPQPDMKWCVKGRDFVVPSDGAYWEVGLVHLQRALEEAEALDLAFARRMEGLANVAPSVVWGCLDPDYDPSDREAVVAQFMTKYLEKFYSRLDAGSEPSVEAVSAEALHKHKAFCKAWSEKHYRGLTPAVTAPAEALAGEFYAHLEPRMTKQRTTTVRLTRAELARLLMRHDDFAAEFASALHYYTANLEQTRAGRNANYKQIRMMAAARVTSYASLGTLLADKEEALTQALTEACASQAASMLHPLTVDWYDVLGQAPPVHRYFEDPTPYQGLSDMRRATAEGRVPPWRFGRQAPPA